MTNESGNDGTGRTHTAFFYGTLMAPEVFFTVAYRNSPLNVAVLKSLHTFQPAVLHGFRRRRVRYADYPGITRDTTSEDASVRGTYVTGLTDANMFHLDAFEGSEYERENITVKLLAKVGNDQGEGNVEGDEVECQTYVFLNPGRLEPLEWDYHEFRTQKMKGWTREDYGFDDTDHLAPDEVEEAKDAAV
ncbi:disease resistance protein aig2-like protein [Apiospora aurea]|uniref:Putative gamma-glutamylcyclotransferase n=1 Tax=Apiospora aurea TaxID=335848 RepID=A0ABR1QYJ3_9PEZI